MVWQDSSPSDLAVWAGADGDLQFRNASLEQPRQNVRLSDGVRIFARLVPAEWTPPPRSDLEARVNRVGLAIRSRDGDWGLNAEGALSIWGRFDEGAGATKVWNATQWFRSTGEIWAVNTNSFADHAGRTWFSTQVPFASLEEFLGRAVAGIREMGGSGAIGIRLGAVGVGETVLPAEFGSRFVEAVGSDAAAEGASDTWTPLERRQLLRSFWNDLMDAYGQRPMTLPEFERAAALRALSA